MTKKLNVYFVRISYVTADGLCKHEILGGVKARELKIAKKKASKITAKIRQVYPNLRRVKISEVTRMYFN